MAAAELGLTANRVHRSTAVAATPGPPSCPSPAPVLLRDSTVMALSAVSPPTSPCALPASKLTPHPHSAAVAATVVSTSPPSPLPAQPLPLAPVVADAPPGRARF